MTGTRTESRTDHGLVIGKFYPPHAGHHLLIRTAAATCRRVTVLVFAHDVESIPLALRVQWLRDSHGDLPNVTIHGAMDNHPIDYDDPSVWDLHMRLFAATRAAVTNEPVTAVFSSEPYGSELARRFGATDVAVDPQRTLVPISGTDVRADPVGNWGHLAPATRAWFARRVVVVGAESTGKTTLSEALADHLRRRGGPHGLTRWVPEHGRDFTIDKMATDSAAAILTGRRPPAMDDLVWRTDEFVTIGQRQNELEDDLARIGGPVLVCDTDTFATGVWHERYVGSPSAGVDALARVHPLYLLTHHDDVPFVQDGIRDGEQIRGWMTDRFVDALERSGRRTVVLRGNHAQRLADGLAAIDSLLAEGWDLADPVTPANGAGATR